MSLLTAEHYFVYGAYFVLCLNVLCNVPMNLIFNIGLTPDLSKPEQGKVRLCNQIAFIFVLVALSYAIFSAFYYPPLIWYPLGAVGLALGICGMNRLGWYRTARMVMAFQALLLTSVYHAYLVDADDPMLTCFLLAQFAMTLLPWVLFDLQEKSLLSICLAICYGIFFGQPWLNDALTLKVDETMLREGFFYYATCGVAVVITISSLAFLLSRTQQSIQDNQQLLEEMHQQNQVLKKQQKKASDNLIKIQRAREEDEKRNWITEGLTKVSGILRSNIDLPVIYQQLVSTMVTYLNANQGGLYVVREGEDERVLRLEACYAYSRQKYLTRDIEIGEGLVGQCYLEKEPIVLLEVPERYVQITSGLGEATPRCLLIMPLIFNEQVVGVLEVASFKPLEEHQQDFVKRAGEDIASALQNKQIAARTQALLELSRQQAEEMQATEEEMRQNMEELQAIQEKMDRKDREQTQIIEELQKATQT